MNAAASETQNLISNILPMLEKLGWKRGDMEFEVSCAAGRIDLLYQPEGRNLVVLEVKKIRAGESEALQQATKYALATGTPIAIATDGKTYLQTFHTKQQVPLKDYEGNPIDIAERSRSLLTQVNLSFLKNNPSLQEQIKSEFDRRSVFKQLNEFGRKAGLTTGIERVIEIAKIIFIKMLSDNYVILEPNDWGYLISVYENRKIDEINAKLQIISEAGIKIPQLDIAASKSDTVADIIALLNTINFNHRYYDINGSLFQNFLSERARGGTTNDLGQYFTPENIIGLIYTLSDYATGKTIYDPFCGTGGILNAFFLRNTQNMRNTMGLATDEKKKFGRNYLFGSEITNAVSLLAKMNMILSGDGHSNIENVDSLSEKNRYVAEDRTFDIVATNIPFDPKTPNDVKTNYFKLSNTASDVANFIEHCTNRCKVGGRVVLIVGKGFLTERQSNDFRVNLLKEYRLNAIYMLYEGIFAPYTQVFSCILVITKNEPKKYVDFFSIRNKKDIEVVANYHNSPNRYAKNFYKVQVADILNNPNCDLRGKIYKQREGDLTIGDLVDYIDPQDTELREIERGLKKLTTPNSIQEGIQLIDTQSNKQVEEGYGTFVCALQKDAIVVARITNKRVGEGRYLGSAMVGDNFGNLITKEYHQLRPKDKKDLYYILHYLRGDAFQEVVELASGTGGQQRIEREVILNEPIPKPSDALRQKARAELAEIEKAIQSINEQEQKIASIKAKIKNTKR